MQEDAAGQTLRVRQEEITAVASLEVDVNLRKSLEQDILSSFLPQEVAEPDGDEWPFAQLAT